MKILKQLCLVCFSIFTIGACVPHRPDISNIQGNKDLPSVQPLSDFLFKQAKPKLNLIDNIHAIEQPLYSLKLGVAGTVDCIAEYEGELAVIDFKTSKKPKPRKWIDHYFV